MKQKAYVRPGRINSIMGIIAASAMFIFGIFFFMLLNDEGSRIGQVFMIFWLLIVLCIIGYNIYNLSVKKGHSAAMAEIELDTPEGSDAAGNDFDAKLRKLEQLKKEGLITEDKYALKRKELMQQKW